MKAMMMMTTMMNTSHAFLTPTISSCRTKTVITTQWGSNMPESVKPSEVDAFESDASTPFEVKLTERVSLDIS